MNRSPSGKRMPSYGRSGRTAPSSRSNGWVLTLPTSATAHVWSRPSGTQSTTFPTWAKPSTIQNPGSSGFPTERRFRVLHDCIRTGARLGCHTCPPLLIRPHHSHFQLDKWSPRSCGSRYPTRGALHTTVQPTNSST